MILKKTDIMATALDWTHTATRLRDLGVHKERKPRLLTALGPTPILSLWMGCLRPQAAAAGEPEAFDVDGSAGCVYTRPWCCVASSG